MPGYCRMYEQRKYRDIFKGISLKFFDVCVYETDLRIGAQADLSAKALSLVRKFRMQLESYIESNPSFLTSLTPIQACDGSCVIAARMCEAARKAGVGPMAAVAGAISEMVGMELVKLSGEVIVENGGDVFIKSDIPRRVGIYAGCSQLSEKLAVEIQPERTPMGICTSSGTVGHSLSFGKADAVVVLSKDTFLADAAATAVCNKVKSMDDINRALEFASGIVGVEGVVIIIGDKIGAWGDVKLAPYQG